MNEELGIRNGLERSAELSRDGHRSIPGGVVSLNRKVEPQIVFDRANGSHLHDMDGNVYIDFHSAFGPHLLGHNDPEVNAAVTKTIEQGTSLMGSGTTPWEIQLAHRVVEAVDSVDKIQITNTGSEGTAHAIRLSRAYTGNDHIVLMLGGYNGWHNEVAREVMPTRDKVGPRVSPGEYPFFPNSAGIPATTQSKVHTVNFNDLESVEYVFKRYPVACVMTEPVLQNVGIVKDQPGYLEGLRKLCDQYNVVLVFDEVKTGFRYGLGGYQSIVGVKPDLSVFGKAIANGYPLGVIGGKDEIMQLFASEEPGKRVLIAGTYNAHPIPTIAAIATIDKLGCDDGAIHKQLEGLGARLEQGLERIFSDKGLTAATVRIQSAFCTYFCEEAPKDWHDILENHDFALDLKYRKALIDKGVYQFPLPTKQGSISAAHTEEDIDTALNIVEQVVTEL